MCVRLASGRPECTEWSVPAILFVIAIVTYTFTAGRVARMRWTDARAGTSDHRMLAVRGLCSAHVMHTEQHKRRAHQTQARPSTMLPRRLQTGFAFGAHCCADATRVTLPWYR